MVSLYLHNFKYFLSLYLALDLFQKSYRIKSEVIKSSVFKTFSFMQTILKYKKMESYCKFSDHSMLNLKFLQFQHIEKREDALALYNLYEDPCY